MRLSDERGVERSELNVQSDPYSMIFKFKVNPSDMEWRLYNQSNDEKPIFLPRQSYEKATTLFYTKGNTYFLPEHYASSINSHILFQRVGVGYISITTLRSALFDLIHCI